jgi:hypothetical protein
MKQDFEIRVAPRDAAELAVSLSAVKGVTASLPSAKMDAPKEKQHGSYAMGFAELAPVIVSVMGASGAFFSLATALLGYMKARRESADKKVAEGKAGESKAPVIVIQNVTVSLADFRTPEALATYLESQLTQRREK